MATAVIAFYAAALIFGLPLTPVLALEVLPLILLTCISAYCLALFLGALVSLKPSLRNMVSQVVRLSMIAICGVNVPVTFWPLAVHASGGGADQRIPGGGGGRRLVAGGVGQLQRDRRAGPNRRLDRAGLATYVRYSRTTLPGIQRRREAPPPARQTMRRLDGAPFSR